MTLLEKQKATYCKKPISEVSHTICKLRNMPIFADEPIKVVNVNVLPQIIQLRISRTRFQTWAHQTSKPGSELAVLSLLSVAGQDGP